MGIVSAVAIIANPSFYRSDEFYLSDHIQEMGLQSYLSAYLQIQPNPDFAFNVRPVSFLLEGFILLPFREYPFLVHLADVMMHWLVAVLMFLAILRFCGQRQLAWISAILFILSPLAAFSVGWSAALMDRLFVLFGLLAFMAAHAYISERRGNWMLAAVFFASLLAILSKETALVLPAVLAIYWFFPRQNINRKRIWATLGAWSAPVLLLMLYRLPYLIDSFNGKITPGYAPNFSNVPKTLFGYFIYPFLPSVEEASFSLFQPIFYIVIGAACHLLFCFLFARAFSARALMAYLSGYFLFLIPVLMLPITHMFANYLYASGIAFSIGLTALLLSAQKKRHTIIPALLIVIAIFHTFVVQRYFYKHGLCLNTILTSLKIAYKDNGTMPKQMSILALPGAPLQPLHYYAVGRKYPLEFILLDWNWNGSQKESGYVYDCDCLVRKRPDIMLEIKDWGPASTTVNQVANPQPDGTGAFWMKVATLENLGELEVLLGGQPALIANVGAESITANFAPERYAQEGKYPLEIRQVASGKTMLVGIFEVKPAGLNK